MFTLPGLELARFRRTTLARLATVVIAIIPALYGCLYLASNWDPTSNLDQLDAAVVNQDTGAELPEGPDGTPGGPLDAGSELTEELTASDDAGFSWHAVDADAAQEGLEDGTYAAVLHIPRSFSADIASAGTDSPHRTQLRVETDDAHNYIVGNIAAQILESVRATLNETTTAEYVDQVYIGFNEIQAKMQEAADGSQEVADGASDLHEGTDSLKEGTAEARAGAIDLAEGLDELSSGAGDLSDGASELASGASDLHDGTTELSEGTSSAAESSGDLADGAQKVAEGTAEFADTADAVNEKAQDVRDEVDAFDKVTAPVIDDAREALDATHDQASGTLQEQADALAERYPDDPEVQALQDGLGQLSTDLDSAHQTISEAADDVDTTRQDVLDATDRAADRINEAADSVHELDDGAHQVSDGAAELHDGLVSLDEGAQQLDDGASDLDAGAQDLSAGASDLATGTQDAANGAHDLKDGLIELDDGAGELARGAGELTDGSEELHAGIAEGAEQVPTYSEDDREVRSDTVAVPVEGAAVRENAVPTYGEGLAPFFLSLALWIGGMVTYMVLNAIPYRALASSASAWRIAWSGYAPGVFFGVLQVAVIFAALTFLLDFTVSSWLLTVAFTTLVAASFHAIHQLCITALGSIGRLVALILLMLQIGAAGGTYPVQTTPSFFQVISPFLPMTYAVEGLRGLIAGGNPAGVGEAAVVLAGFGVLALAATAFFADRKRTVSVSRLYPSLQI